MTKEMMQLKMKTDKKRLRADVYQFDTFNPANILLQNAKSGAMPQEEGALILTDFMTQSAVTRLAKYEPMTKMKKKFTYLAGGAGAYWVNEGEVIQTAKAEWLTAEMTAKKLGVIIPVTKEFLNYTLKAFFEEMRAPIAEAFAVKFDQAAIFGTDSPFGAGKSLMEGITTAGNKVALGSLDNLYLEFNAAMALLEDKDHDANGHTTTRKFKQKLRGAVDENGKPIFNDVRAGVTGEALGLPIGYVDSKSWDYTKAHLLTGDWKMTRFGIPQGMEYSISEEATLSGIVDQNGKPINLWERDMVALKVTQTVAWMRLKDDAFAAIVPPVVPPVVTP